MGYYTDYKITANPDITEDEDFVKFFEEVTDYKFNDGEIHGKWYSYHDNMVTISKQYPYVQFTVEGSGEENGDLWIAYFLDGAYQNCKVIISFEPRTLW